MRRMLVVVALALPMLLLWLAGYDSSSGRGQEVPPETTPVPLRTKASSAVTAKGLHSPASSLAVELQGFELYSIADAGRFGDLYLLPETQPTQAPGVLRVELRVHVPAGEKHIYKGYLQYDCDVLTFQKVEISEHVEADGKYTRSWSDTDSSGHGVWAFLLSVPAAESSGHDLWGVVEFEVHRRPRAGDTVVTGKLELCAPYPPSACSVRSLYCR